MTSARKQTALNDSNNQAVFRLLGRVPSGIYIVTIREPQGDKQTGILCSWIMQAGFDPPMLTIAVKQQRYVADWLTGDALFAINIVADSGKSLLSHFGKGFEPGEDAFRGLSTEPGPMGLTLISDHVLGHLICEPKSHVNSGDHRIYIAEVVDGLIREEAMPMVHVRASGQHY